MKRLKKYFISIFSILLFVVSCTSSPSNKAKKLKVGMELQFPPFETIDTNGKPYGLSVELAEYLANKLGMELEIVNTAYSGLIPALQSEKIDIILSSMGITEERSKVVDFSEPYAISSLGLLINKNSTVNSIKDANESNIKVAVKKGTTGHIYAEKNLPKSQIMIFDKESAAILEVVQGKADIFIYGQDSIYKAHKQNEDTTRINLEPIGDNQYWGIAVKKGNKDLLEKINLYVSEFKKEGGFDKLSDKYLFELKQVFKELNLPFFFDTDK